MLTLPSRSLSQLIDDIVEMGNNPHRWPWISKDEFRIANTLKVGVHTATKLVYRIPMINVRITREDASMALWLLSTNGQFTWRQVFNIREELENGRVRGNV